MKQILKVLSIIVIMATLWVNLSYADGAFIKLGRGLANTFTGWIEIFTTLHESCLEHDYIVGYFYGLPKGAVRAMLRTIAGVYEVVTFPIPIPADYESVIEPEFVTVGMPLERTRNE